MTLQPLATNEVASNGGFTHLCVITANDLTDAVINETQTITICNLAIGDRIGHGFMRIKTAFAPGANLTMSLGDEDGVDTHMAAKELATAGTEILAFSFTTTVIAALDADVFKAVFTPASGATLLSVTSGEVHIYFQFIRVSELMDAKAAVLMTK